MNGFVFKRARRQQARLRLALASVSGAGKTMGALRLAHGIVQALIDTGQIEGPIEGKIAVIDTERSSAALYAHVVPFDHMNLEPPYSVDRYQQAIEAAERAGYVVCIIDQISHAWAGEGGQLEWVDTLKTQARNAISPWTKVTPAQQRFYDTILRSGMHIIATMRSKTEWVIEEQIVDGRKKAVPVKIGLSPVQRDGIEYEFTTVLDIDLASHAATASKDRTSLFADRSTFLDEACGRRLAEWLVAGDKPAESQAAVAPQAASAPPTAGAHEEIDLDLELAAIHGRLHEKAKTLPLLATGYAEALSALKALTERAAAAHALPCAATDWYRDCAKSLAAEKDKLKTKLTTPADPQLALGATNGPGDPQDEALRKIEEAPAPEKAKAAKPAKAVA